MYWHSYNFLHLRLEWCGTSTSPFWLKFGMSIQYFVFKRRHQRNLYLVQSSSKSEWILLSGFHGTVIMNLKRFQKWRFMFSKCLVQFFSGFSTLFYLPWHMYGKDLLNRIWLKGWQLEMSYSFNIVIEWRKKNLGNILWQRCHLELQLLQLLVLNLNESKRTSKHMIISEAKLK